MGKDIRESALDKGGASPVAEGPTPDDPSIRTQRDEWNIGSIASTQAAKDSDSDALVRFYQEHHEIENAIREHESLYQATGESISEDDAVALARRIRNLHLSHSFDGHADYVSFLVGQCLKLKEGQAAGEVYTAIAKLEVKNPPPAFPEWGGTWRTIKLAVPAELNAAFGVQSFAWLRYRSEDFARDYERKGFPPDSPSSRLFDGGNFAFAASLDPESRGSHLESRAVSVVPAPNEATIRQFLKDAESSRDSWDALTKAAAILRKHRQPGGKVLRDWAMDVLGGLTTRPKGTTASKWPRDALRDYAIVEAVAALERCGMQAVTSDREPGPACEAVADAFSQSPATVRNHWKERYRTLNRTDQYREMAGP